MKIFIIIAVLIVGSAAINKTHADNYYCVLCATEVNDVTNITEHYTTGLDEKAFSESTAATMAMTSLQFDFSDSAVQIGVGGGFYRGESKAAFGIAKRIGQSFLLSASVTEISDHTASSVGATFRFH